MEGASHIRRKDMPQGKVKGTRIGARVWDRGVCRGRRREGEREGEVVEGGGREGSGED